MVNPATDTEVMAFYAEAQSLLDDANTRVIATNEDAKTATNDLSIIAKLRKAMETKRKGYLQPFNDHVKFINDTYKTLMAPVEQADRITRDKWTAYTNAQAALARKQEEINRLRMEATRKEAEMNNGEIKESVNLVEVVAAPTKTVTDLGSASQKANWTYEIVSFKDLSDDYKLPNTAALNALARSVKDSRPIPGLKIFNNPGMVVRPK
jgi:hypothetical protein